LRHEIAGGGWVPGPPSPVGEVAPGAQGNRELRAVAPWNLTCDTIGGLERGRLANLRVLMANLADLRATAIRGCRVARFRMSGW